MVRLVLSLDRCSKQLCLQIKNYCFLMFGNRSTCWPIPRFQQRVQLVCRNAVLLQLTLVALTLDAKDNDQRHHHTGDGNYSEGQ
jgi:hypothetical protein